MQGTSVIGTVYSVFWMKYRKCYGVKLECGLFTISTDIGKMAHILCILDEVCNYSIQTLYCDTCRPQDTVPSKRASKKKITLFCGNLRFFLRNEKTCFFIGKCVF